MDLQMHNAYNPANGRFAVLLIHAGYSPDAGK
jgi:hypothetical protein